MTTSGQTLHASLYDKLSNDTEHFFQSVFQQLCIHSCTLTSQKLYCQKIRDVDSLKRVLLHCYIQQVTTQ